MNRTPFLLSSFTFISLSAAVQAYAADAVNISITGAVTADSCTIGTSLAGGYNVELGTYGRTKLQSAGNAGEWKALKLILTDCPAGTTMVTGKFTGTADSTDHTLYSNTNKGSHPARNVAVQLVNSADESTVLFNQSTMTVRVDSTLKSATFPLQARLYSPAGGATPGEFTATILIDFTYQ